MSIVVENRTKYGGNNVTDKYSPFDNIQLERTDPAKTAHTKLVTNRAAVLRATGRLGTALRLTTSGWQAILTREAANLPPLVVISSNRSAWIKKALDAADLELACWQNVAAFDGPGDLRAIADHSRQGIAPPIYALNRIGLHRHVYIVVHYMEYATYRAALQPLNAYVTVVGWSFQGTQVGARRLYLVGFGASRFAAMEFCKLVRRSGATWNYAWLIDDNTVALNAFPGFAIAEAAIAQDEYACAGFQGGSVALSHAEIAKYGEDHWTTPPPTVMPAAGAGLVQQTALWNVQYLDQNNLNFGPVYVASAEDVSLVKYFDVKPIPYLWYSGIKVYKQLVESKDADNSDGANRVNAARQKLEAWMANAEAAVPGGQQAWPPPVNVRPANEQADRTLSSFVLDTVLPNSQVKESRGKLEVQNRAKCQGVEQIICKAIEKKVMLKAGHDASFKINGDQQQAVITVDV